MIKQINFKAKGYVEKCVNWFVGKINAFIDCLLSKRTVVCVLLAFFAVIVNAQTGSAGFEQATNTIKGYAGPVQKLIYALASVIGIVSGFNIYNKMQNGDQDTKKQLIATIGGCVALLALATGIPAFFK
ncbi:MAG: DUF4134 domain-containing protein [Aeriscardovia sp.]|nr:DUF4134 domain-containing protein [Aeriscardovia sp.]